jgi:hypothetical protein
MGIEELISRLKKCKYTVPNFVTKVSISKKLKLKNEKTGHSQTFAFENGAHI